MKISFPVQLFLLLLSLSLRGTGQTVSNTFTTIQIADLGYQNEDPFLNKNGLVVWYGHGRGELEEGGGTHVFAYKDGERVSPTVDHPTLSRRANLHPRITHDAIVWMTTRSTAEGGERETSWILQEPPDEVRFDPASPELHSWYAVVNLSTVEGGGPAVDFNLEPQYQELVGPISNGTTWAESYVNAWTDLSLAKSRADGNTNIVSRLKANGAHSMLAPGTGPRSLRATSGMHEFVRLPLTATNLHEFQWLTHDRRNDIGLKVDGDFLAWQKAKAYPFGWEIMVLDGTNRLQITTNYYYDLGVQVHDRQVTWYGWDGNDYEIFLFDAESGITSQITSNEYDDVSPQLWNGQLAWEGHAGLNPSIWFWAGSASSAPVLISHNTLSDTRPRIWEGRVVWQGDDGYDHEIYLWDGSKYIDTEEGATPPTAVPISLVGNTKNFLDDVRPHIQDGYVVWMSYIDNEDAEIILYDLETKVRTQLTDNDYADRNPHTVNRRIVWQSLNFGKKEIWLSEPKAN